MSEPNTQIDAVSKYLSERDIINKSNIIVNVVNIADIIDSKDTSFASSCIVLVGIEPLKFKNLSVEGLKRDIKISRDHEGNVYINNVKAKFQDIGNGIRILVILSDENISKDY